MDKVKRIKELVSLLHKASNAYYNEDKEIMSNPKYDKLYDELESLEQETGMIMTNSPTQTVNYDMVNELQKVRHVQPMLSADKTKDVNELEKFLGTQVGILSWKLDGLTIVLTYNSGKLKSAVTRGSHGGEIGEDVTHNIRTCVNLPKSIPYDGELILRGECYITYDNFNKINSTIEDVESKYKNPRNLASGSCRQLDSSIAAQRYLEFKAFTLVKCDNKPQYKNQQFQLLQSLGFDVVEHKLVTKQDIKQAVSEFNPENYGIPVDGLILEFNDTVYGESLGTTSKFPLNMMALKWKDELVETTLVDIEWSPSRTGLLNPVAIFEPVEIDGTTVSRASLHNLSIMEDLQLGIGDTITVYKANMIIPTVDDNLTRSDKLFIPMLCPVCGEPTHIQKDNDSKVLTCTNPNCKAKLVSRLSHFVSKESMNIEGLSEATIEKFVEKGWLKCLSDIYSLKNLEYGIKRLGGFGEKSYKKIIDAIEKSKKVKLANFIRALGIPMVGSSQSKELSKKFNGNWYALEKAIQDGYDFTILEGFGETLNKNIHDWYRIFSDSKDSCLPEIVMFEQNEVVIESDNELSGLVFVITGSVNHFANRNELKVKIEALGGKVTGSVTNKTNFLINNDRESTSGKNKTARELGVKVISEEEFLEMIG